MRRECKIMYVALKNKKAA